ncbi:hypothetical protein [Longimicrobium sp.]|uniref:hypothetical protein n=1 Tax=Longimicrobium sp. TaxID=2029185 RepID=UPI002B9301EB|nr:hypothetical protein [Longimicrobium sp.]HSU17269.1 hypothetical protein [Longimicrobium sp.]
MTLPTDEPADPSHPERAAERHLAALADEGRARQAAALAEEKAEARRIERRERREVERLGRANIRNALLDSPRRSAPPLLTIASAAVVAGTGLLLFAGERGSLPGLALILLVVAGYFPARWIVGRRQVRAEAAWLRALPFPVRGYFRVLGGTPAGERQVRLRIRFRGAAPERQVLEGLLGRVHIPATARLTGGSGHTWRAESGPIRTVIVDDVDPTNLSALSWMRTVIGEALIPLHGVFPLRGAEFSE